jgi:hypothetical protein
VGEKPSKTAHRQTDQRALVEIIQRPSVRAGSPIQNLSVRPTVRAGSAGGLKRRTVASLFSASTVTFLFPVTFLCVQWSQTDGLSAFIYKIIGINVGVVSPDLARLGCKSIQSAGDI